MQDDQNNLQSEDISSRSSITTENQNDDIAGKRADQNNVDSNQSQAVGFADIDAIQNRLGNNVDLLDELLGMFVEHCDSLLVEVYDALAARDAAELKDALHAVKGVVASFSLRLAYDVIEELELSASRAEYDDIDKKLPQFEDQLQQLIDELKSFVDQAKNGPKTSVAGSPAL